MKQEYKKTFEQIHVSDELEEKLLNIPQNISSDNKKKRYTDRRFAYVALVVAMLICVPTISVLAANGFDVKAVFGRVFGDKVAIVEDNAALPEVNVLSNTFENLDIAITGIVGDKNLMHISMDITKKNGSSFSKEEEEKFNAYISLKEFNDLVPEEIIKGQREGIDIGGSGIGATGTNVDGIEYEQTTSEQFHSIYNDKENNKLSLVYAASIDAIIDGEVRNIPGETIYFRIREIDGEASFGDGLWEAEFTANYKETDSIKLDVNQVAHMPEWGEDDKYIEETEMMVNTVELSPLRLKYICEYSKKSDYSYDGESFWDKIYIVMEDGSAVGNRSSFENYLNSVKGESENIGFGISGSSINGGDWESDVIFDKPIDTAKVKEVHIGSLTIDVK